MSISFNISASALIDPIVKVLRLVAERTDLIRNFQDHDYPPKDDRGWIVFGRDVSERLFQSILFLCREFGPESKSPLSFSFEMFLVPPEFPYSEPPQWGTLLLVECNPAAGAIALLAVSEEITTALANFQSHEGHINTTPDDLERNAWVTRILARDLPPPQARRNSSSKNFTT